MEVNLCERFKSFWKLSYERCSVATQEDININVGVYPSKYLYVKQSKGTVIMGGCNHSFSHAHLTPPPIFFEEKKGHNSCHFFAFLFHFDPSDRQQMYKKVFRLHRTDFCRTYFSLNLFVFVLQKHPFILMYEERFVDVASYVCRILDQIPSSPISPMYVDWSQASCGVCLQWVLHRVFVILAVSCCSRVPKNERKVQILLVRRHQCKQPFPSL